MCIVVEDNQEKKENHMNHKNMMQKCDKEFKREKNFKCNACDKTFYAQRNLTYHTRQVHEDKRKFPCNKCDNTFRNIGILQDHVSLMHEQVEKSHFCTICDERYISEQKLKAHLKKVHLERTLYIHVNFVKQNCFPKMVENPI